MLFPSHDRSSNGFMLLEVIIAVGVFAFAVVGMSLAMNQLIDVELFSREEQRLRLEVQSRVAESRLEPIEEGVVELREGTDGTKYRRIIEPLELENMDGVALGEMYLMRVEALRGDTVVQFSETYIYGNALF